MTAITRRAATLLPLAAALARPALAQGSWKPSRPINLIVPWAAGGSTDSVTRVTASELEKPLGQSIVIINQPGASGAIGTKSAYDAARDGYTWTAGAVQDLGSYEALGSLKVPLSAWELFLTVANVSVLSVPAASPYTTAAQLIAAMKAQPNAITVATAGVTSSGHAAMDMIAAAAKVSYRNVTYDGGSPAVLATVAGETNATTQVASEEADMIRGKMLRPLAAVADKPLPLQGFGTIPAITDTLPGLSAPANYFGIFLPKGVPPEVTQTLSAIWKDTIPNSPALKQYALDKGALFAPVMGSDAAKLAFPAIQANVWQLYANGQIKVSPDTLGIPKP